MADISATKTALKRVPYQPQVPYETRVLDISPVTDGVTAVATHTLYSIPATKALVGFKVVCLTDLDSATNNTTVAFAVNSVALTGTVTEAGMAAGLVIAPAPTLVGATSGVDLYGDDAAMTLTMAVGTAAITAGRFLIFLDLIDITAITDNG
jgi:hypothetical protein